MYWSSRSKTVLPQALGKTVAMNILPIAIELAECISVSRLRLDSGREAEKLAVEYHPQN